MSLASDIDALIGDNYKPAAPIYPVPRGGPPGTRIGERKAGPGTIPGWVKVDDWVASLDSVLVDLAELKRAVDKDNFGRGQGTDWQTVSGKISETIAHLEAAAKAMAVVKDRM